MDRGCHAILVRFYQFNILLRQFVTCRWTREFETNQVLVMTAQIFVNVLEHAFFSMRQVNILVFDECHAAVDDSPMRQVLNRLGSCEDG
jgi:ERCC4-related helicase